MCTNVLMVKLIAFQAYIWGSNPETPYISNPTSQKMALGVPIWASQHAARWLFWHPLVAENKYCHIYKRLEIFSKTKSKTNHISFHCATKKFSIFLFWPRGIIEHSTLRNDFFCRAMCPSIWPRSKLCLIRWWILSFKDFLQVWKIRTSISRKFQHQQESRNKNQSYELPCLSFNCIERQHCLCHALDFRSINILILFKFKI